MSLLDDVSIVVTPNGYKAGELYAVIPVPTEGAEEIVDSSFANDLDDWSKYGVTSATGGIVTIGASANSGIHQTILTEGVRYTVTINVVSVNSTGTSEVTDGNGNNLYTITETGIQTFTFVSVISSETFLIRGMSNALFSLSSVSVKEYTSADMDVTRATAATRVDEDGLVNYAEVIGGEEVTNGDFSNGTTGWVGNPETTLSVSNNELDIQSSGAMSQYGAAFSNVNFELGKQYIVQLTVVSCNNPSQIRVGGSSSAIGYSQNIWASGDIGIGTHSKVYTPSQNNAYLAIGGRNDVTTLVIDNVSVKEVTRDNVPRIDYTGGGCPHILAEPQRTNLIPYSEDFSEWTIARATLGANITAPNGANDGYSIIATAVADDHYVSEYISVVDTNIYTYSAYLKKGSKSWARLWNTSVGYVDFDLENGVVGTQSSAVGSIELFGDGWYRCSIVYTATVTGGNNHRIYTLDGDNDKVFSGDGSTINLYMFGAQLEQGSYPTSYIPTSGSTVTRNQDIFTRDGIGSLINSTEGVLFVEASTFENGADCRITLSDGTITNRVSIEWDILANTIKGFVGSDGNLVSPATYNQTDYNKIAIKYKENDCALWINGDEVDTDFAVSVLSGVNQLEFSNYGGSLTFEGKVKQLQVYKTALTDVQLAALTS